MPYCGVCGEKCGVVRRDYGPGGLSDVNEVLESDCCESVVYEDVLMTREVDERWMRENGDA